MRAGTLVEFQGHVTPPLGPLAARNALPGRGSRGKSVKSEDDKTASFQWREPFAINPLVAACLKQLNFRGFAAGGAGLMGPDPTDSLHVFFDTGDGFSRDDALTVKY